MRKSKSIVGITNQYPLGMHVDMQQQLYDLIHPFAADKILLDATDIPSWKSDIDLEKESVREPTASKVTKYLSEKSKKRSEIVSLLFQEVRLASKSPIDTRSAAGHRLRIVTDTYKGLQNENMNDATGHIAGLLLDLEKTDAAADLATIGMTPLVQMLRTINSEFITLRDERLKSEASIGVVKGSTLRAKNDEAANEIFKHIEAAYLSTSSDDDRKAIGELIDRINRVIQHTTTSYRRSLAQKKVSADRKKTPKQPNDPKQPKEPKKKRKESDPDIRLPEEEPKKPDNGGDGKKPGEDKKPTPGGGGSGSGGGTGGNGDPDIHLPEE
jgi:hypothetical protein